MTTADKKGRLFIPEFINEIIFDDDRNIDNNKKSSCWYIHAKEKVTGRSEFMKIQMRANGNKNDEIDIVIFQDNIYDKDGHTTHDYQAAYRKFVEDGTAQKEGFYADVIMVPITPHFRYWATEGNNHKAGDLVIDSLKQPIVYDAVKIAILTDEAGNPLEDAKAKARRWMNKAIASGQAKFVEGNSNPDRTEEKKPEGEKITAEQLEKLIAEKVDKAATAAGLSADQVRPGIEKQLRAEYGFPPLEETRA